MQFLIAIPFFLTVYSQILELEPLKYYSKLFPSGTKISISGEATQFCQAQQGKIVQNILSKSEFQTDALSFVQLENDTILILNQKGQISNQEQVIILTLPNFESKNCRILDNSQTIAVYCLDTQQLYIISDFKNVSEYQLDDIKDVQKIQERFIVLRGKQLFFNYNEIIDSITDNSIDAFKIIDDKSLVFVAQQNQTSVIYIYKFLYNQFVYNRRIILKKLYYNITSILMTENEDVYFSTPSKLIKYTDSFSEYDIRNIKNLYDLNKQEIVIAISDQGVFQSEKDQIELYDVMANPMQIIDMIVGKNNHYVLSRQYFYQVSYSVLIPQLVCYPQIFHKSRVYELRLKENDKVESLIEVQVQQAILTNKNQYWLWIAAGLFFVGILVLVYCIYGSYRFYKLRYMKYLNEQKGIYQKQF